MTNELQIYLYGPRENGWLDLPPNARLDLESLAELFDEQLAIGEYSLPNEFPWTENNLRLTGFAHRPTNGGSRGAVYECDVYDKGFPEIQRGKLTILGTKGSFTPGRGSFSATISGTKGVFGNAIRNKKLKDLQLGGQITFTESSSRAFATAVMKGDYPQFDYLRFAPVVRQEYFDTSRPDYDNEFLVQDTVNNLVYTGAPPTGWQFARPDPALSTGVIPEGQPMFKDFRTVPFFQLKHVFRSCFAEFGFEVSGAFLSTQAFDDVYIDNNYSIEEYGGNFDTNRRILPGNHMPDMLIRDFIIQVCQWLNLYLRFTGGNSIEVRHRSATLSGTRSFDITPWVEDAFETTRDNEETARNTNFAYASDSTDGLQQDSVKDLTGKNIVATVRLYSDLATLDVGRQLTTDDIALVESEGIYYQVANATQQPVLWDAYASALQPVLNEQDEQANELPCAPLAATILLNTGAGVYLNQFKLGVRQKGSYANNRGIRVSHPFGLRVMYISMQVRGSYTIPVSYYQERDELGNQIQPYSLMLKGENGIIKNFHQQWAENRRQGMVLKTRIAGSTAVLGEIKKADRLIIAETQYLLYRIERTLPMDPLTSVELVPL